MEVPHNSFRLQPRISALSAALHALETDEAVVVNVPFAFQYGSKHFSAGQYTIRLQDQDVLVIQGEKDAALALVWFDEESHPSNTSKVVFLRYGDNYVLQEVWVAGETRHTYCLPTKAEKREMAANKAISTTVEVAAWRCPVSGKLQSGFRNDLMRWASVDRHQ